MCKVYKRIEPKAIKPELHKQPKRGMGWKGQWESNREPTQSKTEAKAHGGV